MRYILDMLEIVGDLSTYVIDTPIEVIYDGKGGGVVKVIGMSAIFIVRIDSQGYKSGHTIPKELGMAALNPRDALIENLLSSSVMEYETFDDIKSEY